MNHETTPSNPTAAAPTAQVIGLADLQPGLPPGRALLDSNPLLAVRARVQVCVGSFEMSVGEWLAARENQVVSLDRAVDDPVDLLIEGKVVARGQLVAIDGSFGVRITELPAPLKP